MTENVTLTEISTAVDALTARLGDRVVPREDPRFDETAAVFVGGPERTPALVVRPQDADEVALALAVAQDNGLPVAVRSGGHSAARFGLVDDGLVIDLRLLDDVELDPSAGVGRAGGGTRAGDYTVAAGEIGHATGFGDTGSVGIAGLALGGGIGYLSRRDGLTIDNLLAADVVLPDGRQVHASSDEEPELFWGLRGGGGNLGVVTRLHLRLVPQGQVTGGMLMLPLTAKALADVVAIAHAAPDELTVMVNALVAPPLPMLPPQVHGKPVLMLQVAWSGDPDQGEAAVAPLRALGEAYVDMLGPRPYPALFQGGPAATPMRSLSRTGFLPAGSVDEAWAQRAIDLVTDAPAAVAALNVRAMGGAIGRVPADATAFAHRDHDLMVTTSAMVPADAGVPAAATWADGTETALGFRGPGYVNWIGAVGEASSRAAYPGATWDRLAAAKAAYDPANVLRGNHNVPPAV